MPVGLSKLDNLSCVVIDEADEMLNMGFIEDLEQILAFAPTERQTALFSATMPNEILKVARRHLQDPVEVRIESKTSTVEKIRQYYWQVKGLHKLALVADPCRMHGDSGVAQDTDIAVRVIARAIDDQQLERRTGIGDAVEQVWGLGNHVLLYPSEPGDWGLAA